MSFSNVPLRNPGRYFEQFVKVVQPISGGGQAAASSYANTPTMAVTSSFVTHNGSNSQIAAAANGNGQSNMFGSYGSPNEQIVQFK